MMTTSKLQKLMFIAATLYENINILINTKNGMFRMNLLFTARKFTDSVNVLYSKLVELIFWQVATYAII